MEYKKIVKDKYNIHIINTDRFKTILLSVIFSNEFNKKDIPYLNLLTKNLISSTKKYKTSSSLAILGEELYGSSISASSSINGNIERMMISLEFLNPKYTEESMIKESIFFLDECLFNPNINNNRFENNYYEINKNSIINSLKSIKDNAYSYAFIKFKNEMFKGTPISYNLYNDIEKINDIKNEDVYNFYLKTIESSKIDIFLIGNITNENDYIKYLDKMFLNKNNSFNKKLKMEINEFNSIKNTIKETRKFSQSQLFIGYTFKDLTDYEKEYVLSFYNGILGGVNNSLLFTEVRENNSLCYSIDSFVTRDPYSIIIETEIDKNNYEKTLKLIDDVINKMKDKKVIETLFNTTKENINTSLNNFYDNPLTMLEHYYKKEFKNLDDIELRREKYMNVTVDDILKLGKKIHKNIIYFLEGDVNEENSI